MSSILTVFVRETTYDTDKETCAMMEARAQDRGNWINLRQSTFIIITIYFGSVDKWHKVVSSILTVFVRETTYDTDKETCAMMEARAQDRGNWINLRQSTFIIITIYFGSVDKWHKVVSSILTVFVRETTYDTDKETCAMMETRAQDRGNWI